jgi:hypothetical protein
LQFWVQNETSTLQLAVGSKQHLLGFYPLTTPPIDDIGSDAGASPNTKEENRVPWWQEYWTPNTRRSKQTASSQATKSVPQPKLIVKYSYEGNDFEKEVKDDEGLILPYPNDLGVRNEDTSSE